MGGYHDARGDIMSTVGVFSTMGGYHPLKFEYCGGYHDTCGGIMSTVGVFSTVGYSNNKRFCCTEHPHGTAHILYRVSNQ